MDAPAARGPAWVERLAAALAILGGIIMCLAVGLVSASVVGRWLFNSPIPADYEMVEIAVGVAVFAFLAHTQARNGHIFVDTFTTRLPAGINAALDGLWGLVLAAFLAFFSWGLYSGGMEARFNGLTLIQLPWPVWPVYLLCALLAALACLVTLMVSFAKFGSSR